MKNVIPVVCALLSACGDVSEVDLVADPDQEAAAWNAASVTSEAHSLTAGSAIDQHDAEAARAPAGLRGVGIDCGTVIPLTDGEYVLSELSHLEAIHRAGCNYFEGNVRIAFTVPLVPSAQRYLFSPASIKEITGRIVQRSKTGVNTTQYVLFTGLEKAGGFEAYRGQACPFPALITVGSIVLNDDSSKCPFPALTTANEIKFSKASTISGFNALTSVNVLSIEGSSVSLSGFKALTNAGNLALTSEVLRVGTWSGSFPVLASVASLKADRVDFKSLTIPKLQSILGDATFLNCNQSLGPLKALKTVGGSLSIDEDPPSYDWHEGPATLTSVGGNLRLTLGHAEVKGYKALKTVGGLLSIVGSMGKISGFAALTTVNGLQIAGGTVGITGFPKLTTVQGGLSIKTTSSATSVERIDAFPVLTDVYGPLTLQVSADVDTSFPKLRKVHASFTYVQDRSSRLYATDPATFPALEEVAGQLATDNVPSSFNALLRVGGTLSILNVPGYLGYHTIPGYRKVNTVGGDLVLDKRVTQSGRDGTQRILDQLVGFTGKVILK